MSLLSILETPFSQVLLLQSSNEFTLLLTVKSNTSCAALQGALSISNNPRPKRNFNFKFKNKVFSALFGKTVETFVVIGLLDVLSTIILNVKFKRKTVTTLWKKNMFL